ncbi:hypothetical protein HYC85_023503 [Camellia sinensis]|uniref:Uncharacterized protein n=1 Tax=Camellia sinensis TaxID=4442 RepID=A0A7J7GIK2_CAMSI|nr:hypothetical protein HYC85_023503 [Camellia sinensis]
MYSSNPTDYQKYTASPQQSAPPPYSHPANGIPVSSTNQFYHEMPHHQPPSAPSLYGQPQSGVPVSSGNQYYPEKPQPAIQALPVWLRRRVRRGIDLLFGVFSSSEKSPPRRGHLLGQGG